MSGYNKVIQMGNLTRDPEVKSLPSGATVTELGLAVNTRYYSKMKEEWAEDVCFLDVSFFGKRGEAIAKHLKKGDPIHIEGRLAFRSWEDKDTGKTRSKVSVIGESFTFVGGKREGGRQGGSHDGDEGFDEVPF